MFSVVWYQIPANMLYYGRVRLRLVKSVFHITVFFCATQKEHDVEMKPASIDCSR